MIDGIARLKQLTYPWRIGIAFCIATLGVLAGMIWMTNQVLRLESSEAEAMQRAGIEENVRLALWRIDSALSPILAQESVRPNSFPSTSPYVKMCFQFAADGDLKTLPSPQIENTAQLMQDFVERVSKDSLFAILPSDTTASEAILSQYQVPRLQTMNNALTRSQLEFEQRRANVFTDSNIGIVQTNNVVPYGIV